MTTTHSPRSNAPHKDSSHLKRRHAELRDLTDRAEITDLVLRLAVALDDGDFETLENVFTENATAQTPGGVAEGRDVVIAQATRNHVGYIGIQHLVTNILIDLGDDDAAIRANLIGRFIRGPERSPARTVGGVYNFRAARTADGWRLTSIGVRLVWNEGEALIPA